jgi:KaiC/GvpD/RAD55 family RecA-like ATPase
MFQPTKKPGAKFFGRVNAGAWIDVDAVLAEYADWKDRTSWPKHKVGDEQYSSDELPPLPNTKPGIVGDFCRTYDVPRAIEEFNLPYEKTANPNRYTYTDGSRPEGAVLYDDGQKLHSHHDSDPANGQHNAYDLVRLHRFGSLDAGFTGELHASPSSKAMAEFARALPGVQAVIAENEFEALPDETDESVLDSAEAKPSRFEVIPAADFAVGSPLAWIIKSVLPRAELVVLYGESGAGKSFLALDLCAAVSRGVAWQDFKTTPGRVIYVCAEGAGGFRNRLNAYARENDVDLSTLPSVVAGAPNLVEVDDVLDLTKAICEKGKADLVVIDTLAATTPGADENSGQDMGKVLAHCKAMHKATGALIVLIHHSGTDASKGARGWSGLKAAADAQIQVTREGDFRTVKIEKMKDGSDGKEWTFKLSPVVLGIDDDGDEITSCVIEFVDPPEPAARAEVLGARQRMIVDLVRDIEAERGDCYLSHLLDEAVKKMPHDSAAKRDLRRQNARNAVSGLLEKKHLYLHGEDRISTTSAVQASTEEFDEKAKA